MRYENPLLCPGDIEDMADRYVLHKLTNESVAKYEEHFLVCQRCAAAVEETDDFRAALNLYELCE